MVFLLFFLIDINVQSYHKKLSKKNAGIIIFFVIIAAIILPLESIGFTNYFTDIINELTKKNRQLSKVYHYIFIIISIYFVSRFLASVEYYLETILDSNMMKFTRNDMFQLILEKYRKKYSEIETGKIVSFFNIIPQKYQDLIYRVLKEIIPKVIAILILNIYFYFLDIRLGLTISLFLLVYIIIIYFSIPKCQELKIAKYNHVHKLNEKLSDKLSNIFSILVNSQGKSEYLLNKQREEEQRKISQKSNLQTWKIDTILSAVQVIFFFIIMILYIYLFKKSNNLRLVASIMIFIFIIQYLDSSKWYIIDYFNLVGVIKSFENEMKVEGKSVSSGKITSGIDYGNIEFQNVYFSYQNKQVLKNINIKLIQNKITSIIGKSGSGKSTLVKLLLGILPPNQGNLLIDGKKLSEFDHTYLHDNIAMVSQDVKLFNDSVYSNISYGNPKITNYRIDQVLTQLNLRNTVFKNLPYGLKTQVGVQGSNLSNGQRQIVLILRAYLQNKKIFILDEPTTALDPNTKQIVLQLIKQVSKNKTTIIVTHDIDTKNISNQIFELNK